jgi:TusA-related sulfurtransferase
MANRQLDAKGLKCPVPIVRAKKEIDLMQPGDVLEVLATDPGSVSDFQGWAKTSKLAVLKEQRTEKDQTGREIYVHVLERGLAEETQIARRERCELGEDVVQLRPSRRTTVRGLRRIAPVTCWAASCRACPRSRLPTR